MTHVEITYYFHEKILEEIRFLKTVLQPLTNDHITFLYSNSIQTDVSRRLANECCSLLEPVISLLLPEDRKRAKFMFP